MRNIYNCMHVTSYEGKFNICVEICCTSVTFTPRKFLVMLLRKLEYCCLHYWYYLSIKQPTPLHLSAPRQILSAPGLCTNTYSVGLIYEIECEILNTSLIRQFILFARDESLCRWSNTLYCLAAVGLAVK